MSAQDVEMAQDFWAEAGCSDNEDFGFQSWMISRRTAITTASVRSAAPNFS
jgi:hypothetical protein